MSLKSWLKDRSRRRRNREASEDTKRLAPLREFVYLDAVSLHSLLVSQNATIPHEVSQAISRADEAEIASTFGGSLGSDLIGAKVKAETTARYQTSNSNSVQSSRKAVIQTLFKELRDLPLEFKLSARDHELRPFGSAAAITNSDSPAVEPADAFQRGTLVEVEVTLAVDPVFKLGAMMNEWTGMADDYPGMFGSHGLLGFLSEAQPIMKVLDRFLAGLIPIKAAATNHVVAEIDGHEYVVERSALAGFELSTRPLYIVGVTEHLGYWRDIRRVLFSGARFTVLCRVARDGIHTKWTPVKLADLFSEVAPDFVDTINAIRSPSAADASSSQPSQEAFADALERYKAAIVPAEAPEWTPEKEQEFQSMKTRLASGPSDAAAQRDAFDAVRQIVTQALGVEPVDPDADVAARRNARQSAGLELWPSMSILERTPSSAKSKPDQPDERMLDVEVIAIYW